MSNSSVVTKIKYDKDIDPGVVVTNNLYFKQKQNDNINIIHEV